MCVRVCARRCTVSQRIYGGQRNFENQSFLPALDFALKAFIQEPLSHLTSLFHSNLIRKLLSFYLFLKDCIYYFMCLRFLSACHFFYVCHIRAWCPEARREFWLPLNWSYRWLLITTWVLGSGSVWVLCKSTKCSEPLNYLSSFICVSF